MREPYMEVLAKHHGLAVMRSASRGAGRSVVDRSGKRRRAIELRNHKFQVPTLSEGGEGNTSGGMNGEPMGGLAQSENLACVDASYGGVGRAWSCPRRRSRTGRGSPEGCTRGAYATRKSDVAVVPKSAPNKTSRSGCGGAGGKGHA